MMGLTMHCNVSASLVTLYFSPTHLPSQRSLAGSRDTELAVVMHQVTVPVCSLLSAFLSHLPTAGVVSFLQSSPLYHISSFHSSPLSTVPPTAGPDPPDRPGPATRPAPGLQSSVLPPPSPFLISHLLPFPIYSLLPLTFAFSLCPSTLILFLSSVLLPPPVTASFALLPSSFALPLHSLPQGEVAQFRLRVMEEHLGRCWQDPPHFLPPRLP